MDEEMKRVNFPMTLDELIEKLTIMRDSYRFDGGSPTNVMGVEHINPETTFPMGGDTSRNRQIIVLTKIPLIDEIEYNISLYKDETEKFLCTVLDLKSKLEDVHHYRPK